MTVSAVHQFEVVPLLITACGALTLVAIRARQLLTVSSS
jgi:hypothetical protein